MANKEEVIDHIIETVNNATTLQEKIAKLLMGVQVVEVSLALICLREGIQRVSMDAWTYAEEIFELQEEFKKSKEN